MGLRSLGSSLVAKASPGAVQRTAAEMNLETPSPENAGQVGSLSRSQVETPLTRAVPEGSDKIIGVKPLIEQGLGVDSNPVVPGQPATASQPGAIGNPGTLGIFAQPGGVVAPVAPKPIVQAPQAGGGAPAPTQPQQQQNAPSSPPPTQNVVAKSNVPTFTQQAKPFNTKVGLRSIAIDPNKKLRSNVA